MLWHSIDCALRKHEVNLNPLIKQRDERCKRFREVIPLPRQRANNKRPNGLRQSQNPWPFRSVCFSSILRKHVERRWIYRGTVCARMIKYVCVFFFTYVCDIWIRNRYIQFDILKIRKLKMYPFQKCILNPLRLRHVWKSCLWKKKNDNSSLCISVF